MKKCILFFVVQFSLTAYGQSDSITLYFEKIINHKVTNIPDVFYNDSCFLTSTLLKIEIDEHANATSIDLSDNAEDWLKQNLQKITKAVDKQKLRRYCDKAGIRKKSILIPIIIQSSLTRCLSKNDFHWTENYYDFKNRRLKGDCFFVEPVILTPVDLVL